MTEQNKEARKGLVVFATPFLVAPTPQYVAALEAEIPLIEAAGYEHAMVHEVGNCYISNARANCIRRSLNLEPDIIVSIDYDLSWKPGDLLKLIETRGEVVAGTYRFKKKQEEYMGRIDVANKKFVVRDDGCVQMVHVPAGFLKITRTAVNKFMKAYPELVYGEPCYPYIDMFNHGVIKWVDQGEEKVTWFGEDFAFAHRWRLISGNDLWCRPDLDITHHFKETKKDGEVVWHDFPGNYHKYLCAQPGGSHDPNRLKAQDTVCRIDLPALLASILDEATGESTYETSHCVSNINPYAATFIADESQQETPSL